MRYIYFIFLSIIGIFLKIVGNPIFPFVWIAFSIRKWARESVYSYSLENGKEIKRLLERNPQCVKDGWKINGYVYKDGFVKRRNISFFKYCIAMCVWVFIDDESDVDTYEYKHNLSYINGVRKAPKFVVDRMIRANNKAIRGNQFDLGDIRGDNPALDIVSTFYWVGRNTAYNFNYKFFQISDESKIFYFKFLGLEFGWKDDGIVNGVKYYKHILGYNF